MDRIIVRGGSPLHGTVTVSGAKNAVLPIIAASLLAEGKSTLLEIPNLSDVQTLSQLLTELGAKVDRAPGKLEIDANNVDSYEAPYEYVRKMRASFLLMGPLLARHGRAKMSLPGGCAIGSRPIDLHLKGFEAMGAEIYMGHGFIEARVDKKLKGSKIYLDFPSVGATENIMMAAVLAEGLTTIENAAEEPEIVDLANYLNNMGAIVKGAGTKVIRIEGVKALQGATHGVIPDRIEAGSFMVAAAATGGNVLVENVISDHLKPVIAKLKEAGVEITEEGNGVRVIGPKEITSVDIKTMPYPGFPTDMQAQMMALMTVGNSTSVITESVFENRFMHVDELKRMGARIKIEGRSAVIEGTNSLTGAPVKATDLRAGAALIIAALATDDVTEVGGLHHIDRGYDDIVNKFKNIGADIQRVSE
ncbi:UDP-N-acetylglucosamine 1-carboxyvinyltransferase [Desulfitispora alkaliphila]|uniref:UDP-N-acetylglucosamine 1-carboxyvinyltransferase n=1 Tax=Desulfitispora alkaliphila TaxID=622674 RepID=UPI003D252A41